MKFNKIKKLFNTGCIHVIEAGGFPELPEIVKTILGDPDNGDTQYKSYSLAILDVDILKAYTKHVSKKHKLFSKSEIGPKQPLTMSDRIEDFTYGFPDTLKETNEFFNQAAEEFLKKSKECEDTHPSLHRDENTAAAPNGREGRIPENASKEYWKTSIKPVEKIGCQSTSNDKLKEQ